jgi:hypothetical protein
MVFEVALSALFLILLGLVALKGRWSRAGIGEVPLVYQSVLVQFFFNLATFTFVCLSLYLLLFDSWRLLMLLFAIGFVTETFIIVPLIERVLYVTVWQLERRAEKALREKAHRTGGTRELRPNERIATEALLRKKLNRERTEAVALNLNRNALQELKESEEQSANENAKAGKRVLAELMWRFDAEEYPETPEEWREVEAAIRDYPQEFQAWYQEEFPGQEASPEEILAWLRDWAAPE